MAHAHDLVLIGPGNDLEKIGQGAGPDDQAVVTSRLERVGQASINPLAIVVDQGNLAVHDPVGPDDLGTVNVADALVPQADSQDGHPGGEPLDGGPVRYRPLWGCTDRAR